MWGSGSVWKFEFTQANLQMFIVREVQAQEIVKPAKGDNLFLKTSEKPEHLRSLDHSSFSFSDAETISINP